MLVAQSMWVDGVAKGNGWLRLSNRCGGNDLVPDRETVGHLGSPFRRADQMTTGPKVLSDAAERKQEPLGLPRKGEAFHHPFPGYQVAHGELLPSVTHRRWKYLNRAENSHQPTRVSDSGTSLM
jgi:hypothetical protein